MPCSDLGAFYQEGVGRSACNACPANTARFSGTSNSNNVSVCSCMQGVSCFSVPKSPKAMSAEGGYLSSIAGFFHAKSAAGEVRLLERLHALEAREV